MFSCWLVTYVQRSFYHGVARVRRIKLALGMINPEEAVRALFFATLLALTVLVLLAFTGGN